MTHRAGGARSLPSIRRYLLARVVGIILLSFAVFSAAAYFIIVRPTQGELARSEMQRASEDVEARLQSLVGQSERLLAILREWSRAGVVSVSSTQEAGPLLIPVMLAQPHVPVIAFADQTGRAFLFGREPDGSWLLRQSDVEKWGGRQRWIRLNVDGSYAGEKWMDVTFDARTRPWFKGAIELASDAGIHWTAPYQLTLRNEFGLTVSSRWTSHDTGAQIVVAVDFRLHELSKATSRIAVGGHGRAALLSVDGRILGLPRDPAIVTEEDLRTRLMKTPREAGLGVFDEAFTKWVAEGRPDGKASDFVAEGDTWISHFREFPMQNRKLVLASVAPRRDFALGTVWDAMAIAGMMAAVLAVAFFSALRFSRRFADVIGALVAESDRIGALQLDAPVSIAAGTQELSRLVDAQERMRKLLFDATRDLKERLKELTALHQAARMLQTSQPIDTGLLQEFVALLPPAWQFPEVCEARIRYAGLVAGTPGWRDSPWKMAAGFTTSNGENGELEIAYLEERPAADEGPFLAEERTLIDSLVEMLAAALERQQARDALAISHQQLETRVAERTREIAEREAVTRTIYESSPAGLSLGTVEGELRRISARLTGMLGYSEGELFEMTSRGVWANSADREAFVDKLSKEGYVRNLECRFRRKSGEPIPVLLNSSIVEISGEKLIATWAQDMTELKAAERSLADALHRQRAIFAASPYGITVFEERRLLMASPSFERMFGYAPGEAVGQSARILFDSDEEFARIGGEMYAATARGETYSYEKQMVRKDRSRFWCRVTAASLAGGESTKGIVALCEDIRERMAAQEALRSANTEQQAIFDSSTSGIALVKDRRIVRCNQRLEEIFGWGPGELNGQSTRVWHVSDEAYADSGERALAAFSKGKTHAREMRMARSDGTQFWCRLSGQLKDPSNPGEGTVWTIDDVSAEHEAAEALRIARNAAEEATRAKSMFLASMSHEIRTPMNGVMGLLQLLSFSKLDTEQRSTLEGASESARSLLRIIDDLLDFSKIEAGKLEIRPEAASVAGLVESVRQVYLGVASSKDLTLRATVDPAISKAVKVDPLRLRQILNNLVSNAIKFTEYGGVEISAVLVAHADGCDEVRFAVTDTGIGIPADAQAKLFQPFVQAASDTAHRFGGTGLGLTICRRLADLMGGRIEMRSEVGRGTTMLLTLTLPIADESELPSAGATGGSLSALVASRRKTPDIEAARDEGTLVLIAEDHPTNRKLATRLLGLLGYAAETAENGREALEKSAAGRYGAILTDCNMPEMDGYELARAIRDRESGGERRIPIIACTANALAGEAERCFEAGMDDFVTKPIELEQLARVMERWLPLNGAQGNSQPRPMPASVMPSGDASAPVDRSSLAVISGGDRAAEREILADFKSANDADMADLLRALAERDIAAVTRASHRIQGACKMVGAMALAGVCERVEAAGRGGNWQDVTLEQAALECEFDRLNAWLAAN